MFFIHLPFLQPSVPGKFWSEKRTMSGSFSIMLCSVPQLRQFNFDRSKEQLSDSLTTTLPFIIRDPWKVLSMSLRSLNEPIGWDWTMTVFQNELSGETLIRVSFLLYKRVDLHWWYIASDPGGTSSAASVSMSACLAVISSADGWVLPPYTDDTTGSSSFPSLS
jgi:hypothetical protein